MKVRRLTESYTSQKANKYANHVGMTLRERVSNGAAEATSVFLESESVESQN